MPTTSDYPITTAEVIALTKQLMKSSMTLMAGMMRDAVLDVTKAVSFASAGSVNRSTALSYVSMTVRDEHQLDSKITSRMLDIPRQKDDKLSSILHHLDIVRSLTTHVNFGQACSKSFRAILPN